MEQYDFLEFNINIQNSSDICTSFIPDYRKLDVSTSVDKTHKKNTASARQRRLRQLSVHFSDRFNSRSFSINENQRLF